MLVDFGRELYVPWQLNEGKALYQDLSYFNGPLSPWINAAAFRIGSSSLSTLFALNLLILLGVTAALWSLATRIGGRVAAMTTLTLFLSIHAASRFTRAGNYNFLAPYSHEATHGLAVSLVAFLLLWLYLRSHSGTLLVLTGFALGLLFLGKPEFLLAALTGVAAGIAASEWMDRSPFAHTIRTLGLMALAGLAVVAVAWARLWFESGARIASRGVLGAWPHLLGAKVADLAFYTSGMGLDSVGGNLATMGLIGSVGSLVLVPTALVARNLPPRDTLTARLGAAAGALLLGLALIAPMRARLYDLARPLPLLVFMVLAAGAVYLRNDRINGVRDPGRLLAFSFSVFAFVLLLKILFNTRFYHYGFVLTVPAVLILATVLTDWIPAWIERHGGWAFLFRAVAVSFLAAAAFAYLSQSRENLEEINISVGEGRDRFFADDRGPLVGELMENLDQLLEPGQTLAVLPEGVMVNFLTRRANPTPYFSFMPPEVLMFGEDKMLAAFKKHTPDWVIFFNRSASEYGYTLLGKDYGLDLVTWIESQYQLHDVVSDPSRRGLQFSTALVFRLSNTSFVTAD